MASTNTPSDSLWTSALHPATGLMHENPDLAFGSIVLPARHLKEQNWNTYRVYKNEKEFVTIEGEAAYDAIAKSGIPKPLRVIRAMKELGDVLTDVELLAQTDITPKPPMEIPKSGVIPPPAPASSIVTA